MTTIRVQGKPLYQWDTDRRVIIEPGNGVTIDDVHFSVDGENSIGVEHAADENGIVSAPIPNILLQSGSNITVYACMATDNGQHTIASRIVSVINRAKPADYVYTEAEVKSYAALKKKLSEKLPANQGAENAGKALVIDDDGNVVPGEVQGSGGGGENGATYTPHVDADGNLSWTNDKGLPNPGTVNIKGEPGDPGRPGEPGKPGSDYVLTEADKAEIAEAAAKLVDIPEGGGALVEPDEDDIPKVFFGGALQQTKDEAVVPFRYISKTQDVSGYAEIKAQGNSSMSYPKKNQTVKLYKDAACEEKLKIDFKGWGNQSKYCFKANWIDLTHARNVVSARLWADVVKSRSNYEELPELIRTSPNQGAVDGFPIKVYADGVYQGRYTANIPKDAWMANMDDELDNHCILCGENYVSGCFRASANINGSDWTDEIHKTVPASIKTRWNEVISFVRNSTDEDFKANLGNYFYVDSLIDYYLFGLVSCGLDAFGKNQLYMTYDGQKWIATMYDMDSTWGLYWNGSKFVATDYARTSYEDYVHTDGNLLYNRLEAMFGEELKARWAELRNGAMSIDSIVNRFERFTDIAPAELVKEDYASTTGGGKFTGIPSQSTNNIQQIRAYANARLAWTDEYVAALTGGEVDPDEPDEPTDGLLYSLPEVTTFDGVDDYIDTGVKLFDTNKDFTVTFEFMDAISEAPATNIFALHSCYEVTPWPGFSLVCRQGETIYKLNNYNIGIAVPMTKKRRVVITKDAAKETITATTSSGTGKIVGSGTTTVFSQNVILGAGDKGTSGISNFWAGTIYQCNIYLRKFSDTEIADYLAGE